MVSSRFSRANSAPRRVARTIARTNSGFCSMTSIVVERPASGSTYRSRAEVPQHDRRVDARTALAVRSEPLALELRRVFDVWLRDEDVRRTVRDRNDIDVGVFWSSLFAHRAKHRGTAWRREHDLALLAPLVAWVLSIWDSKHCFEGYVETFFAEKPLVVGDPQRRQVHRERRPVDDDLLAERRHWCNLQRASGSKLQTCDAQARADLRALDVGLTKRRPIGL